MPPPIKLAKIYFVVDYLNFARACALNTCISSAGDMHILRCSRGVENQRQHNICRIVESLASDLHIVANGALGKQVACGDFDEVEGSLRLLASPSLGNPVKSGIAGLTWNTKADRDLAVLLLRYNVSFDDETNPSYNNRGKTFQAEDPDETTSLNDKVRPIVRGLVLCCVVAVLAIAAGASPALLDSVPKMHKKVVEKVCQPALLQEMYKEQVSDLKNAVETTNGTLQVLLSQVATTNGTLQDLREGLNVLAKKIDNLTEAVQENGQKLENYNNSATEVATLLKSVKTSVIQLNVSVKKIKLETEELGKTLQTVNKTAGNVSNKVENLSNAVDILSKDMGDLNHTFLDLENTFQHWQARITQIAANSRWYLQYVFPDCSEEFLWWVEVISFLTALDFILLALGDIVWKFIGLKTTPRIVRIVYCTMDFLQWILIWIMLCMCFQSSYLRSIFQQIYEFLCWLPTAFGFYGGLCSLTACILAIRSLGLV